MDKEKTEKLLKKLGIYNQVVSQTEIVIVYPRMDEIILPYLEKCYEVKRRHERGAPIRCMSQAISFFRTHYGVGRTPRDVSTIASSHQLFPQQVSNRIKLVTEILTERNKDDILKALS